MRMKTARESAAQTLILSRSNVFSGSSPGLRVLSKKYFVNMDVVHGHEFFELVLVRSGRGVHVTESGENVLERGDVFLIRPGNLHRYRELHSLEVVNILYLPERLNMPLGDLYEMSGYMAFFEVPPGLAGVLHLPQLRLNEAEMTEAGQFIEMMMREQTEQRAGSVFGMIAGFMQLVLLISRVFTRSCGQEAGDLCRVGRLLAFLEEHCSEPLQVSELARKNGVSVRTLERLFREVVNRSPGEYLTELRLNRGAKLLLESESSVAGVARQAGFATSSYFARLFRRKFGCLPREYRKQHKIITPSFRSAANREDCG